jgi:4-aminobutyrate--pyruvate transaminase
MQANGVIGRAMGDTLAFSPPLIITQADIEEMLARTHKALDDVQAWLST